MPGYYITWDELPQRLKDMDPEERETALLQEGVLYIPRFTPPPQDPIYQDAAWEKNRNKQLADTSSSDVMGFGPGVTHPKNSATMAKLGVGAGSAALGGAGPVGAAIVGGINALAGPDPFSGRGAAEAAANIAFGRLAPFMNKGTLSKGGNLVQGLKNAVTGGGQVAATQALGSALTKDPLPMSGDQVAAGALASAVIPPAAGRFLKAVQNATPMVRARMKPVLDKLGMTAQEATPLAPTVAPKPPAIATAPTAQAPPVVQQAAEEAANPLARSNILVDEGRLSRQHVRYNPDEHLSIAEQLAEKHGGLNRDLLQRQMNLYANDADKLIADMTEAGKLAPAVPQLGGLHPYAGLADQQDLLAERLTQTHALLARPRQNVPRGTTPAPTEEMSMEDKLRASLRAKGIPEDRIPARSEQPTPPAAAPEPAAASAIPPPATPPLEISQMDEMAARNPRATAFKRLGGKAPSAYIEETVSGKDWSTLPDVMREMDDAFPDGQFRNAVRQKITEKVLDGVGESGSFGDLSPLQRIQAFGKQKFGEKTGLQIINQIFDSREAYRNLSDLQDIIQASGRGALESGGKGQMLKVFVNKMKPVIGTSLPIGGLTFYYAMGSPLGLATAAAGAGVGAVKAFSLSADAIAEYVGKKNTKWADVLYDLASGGNRYSSQTISNVISGLRRRAEDERDLTMEQALEEMGTQ